MKKSEYLRELKENLEAKISSEELRDILSDYESFFLSGKEEGKADDVISEELGSPAFLAKSLLEGHEENQYIPDKRIAMPGKRLCAYLIDSFIAIIPVSIAAIFILRTFAFSLALLVTYPSPLVGAMLSASFPAYKTMTRVTTQTEIITSEKLSNENKKYSVPIETTHVISDNKNLPLSGKPGPLLIVVSLSGILFYLLYSFICTLFLKGQTIGKKMMRIKIKRTDTATAGNGRIFFREFIGKILLNSIPLIPLISIFTILLTSEHKALHDMLSDTIVSDL